MLGLVHLVADGVLGCGSSAGDRSVVVLGNLLVGFLGCGGTGTLDSLRDVVAEEKRKEDNGGK